MLPANTQKLLTHSDQMQLKWSVKRDAGQMVPEPVAPLRWVCFSTTGLAANRFIASCWQLTRKLIPLKKTESKKDESTKNAADLPDVQEEDGGQEGHIDARDRKDLIPGQRSS